MTTVEAQESLETVVTMDVPNENGFGTMRMSNCKQILFRTKCFGQTSQTILDYNFVRQWSYCSEYIETITELEHDQEVLIVDLSHILDTFELFVIFQFFSTQKLVRVSDHQKENVMKGLAYFGIKMNVLQSIAKGFGRIYNLAIADQITRQDEINFIEYFSGLNHHDKQLLDQKFIISDNVGQEKFDFFLKNQMTPDMPYYKIEKCCYQPFEVVANFRCVISRIHRETYNIFQSIPECFVAGGFVCGLITQQFHEFNFNYSDCDVFLITKDANRAVEIIKTLFRRMKQVDRNTFMLRTKYTITLCNRAQEIQIILKLYDSMFQVLSSFDIDCCCVGYRNNQLYALPRFIRSLLYQGNLIDPNRDSKLYLSRLYKYLNRNFRIFIPGINVNDPEYNRRNRLVQILNGDFSSVVENDLYGGDVVKKCKRNRTSIEQFINSPDNIREDKSKRYEIISVIPDATSLFQDNIFEPTFHQSSLFDDIYLSNFIV